MKYRILNKEEMTVFDEDFKHFLITNGVTNEEWIEMNQSDQKKATQLVELFSDTVFQKVYEKMNFIEFRSASSCIVFKFDSEEMELISLNRKDETIELSTPESIHESLVAHTDRLTFFKTKKKYIASREEEMHQLMEQGCFVSSAEFWDALQKVM